MKKVLMVMGFALCASIAFAQTTRISPKDDVKATEKVTVSKAQAPVDYKASIFGKANGHDTIQVFKIDNASDYTVGVVTSSDRINDTLVGNANAHNVAGDGAKWKRYSSIAAYRTAFPTTGLYNLNPNLGEWIIEDIEPSVSPREPQDDGFMLLSFWETQASAGIYNTYFTLPVVARPADAVMIEVSITQSYRKYYEKCYIDYKVNGQWYAREINVDGIDASVNTWSPNKMRYVMPYRLNQASNIELRMRGWSNHRGSAFGYWWALDNIAVMKLTQTQFWALNSPTGIDGFYGMIPQGMEIPLTWGVSAQNLSIDDIPGAKATLNVGTTRTSLSEGFHGDAVDVNAGNFDTVYPIVLNERGFYRSEYSPDHGYQAWINHSENFENTTGTLVGGYQGRGLPVATTGKNFYSINVAGGNLSRDYDTIAYYVTPELSFASGTGREGGYRWGRDNGVITSNTSFVVAFTDADANGNVYVSSDDEDGHSTQAGYTVHSRFITGNDIPQGWVFRGLELIAATDREMGDMVGAAIVPVTYKEHYEETADGTTLYFNNLPCGIDGLAFEVSENDINDQLYTDGMYITPDQGYKAINIQFVEQPALEPNTSYRFGYRLADDAQFALAEARNSFLFTNDTGGVVRIGFGYGMGANDTIAQYAQAAAAANDYRYQFYPLGTYLDVMVKDPNVDNSITAWNIDYLPLIRPIVGPARPVETATLEGDCQNNTDSNGVMISRASDQFCNGFLEVTAGSQQRITFEPIGDHSIIDSVLLDGVALTPYDEATGEGDYYAYPDNVLVDPENENSQVLLARDYWVYIMGDIQANSTHTFTVYSHWEEFDTHIGIDPVAPEVRLSLAPNPATSSVKLNLKGVNGMVNCSILDMSGRVIYNANINAESEHMINVSNIPAGAYFVRVTNDTFSKIEKLIIK